MDGVWLEERGTSDEMLFSFHSISDGRKRLFGVQNMTYQLHVGRCEEVLKSLPDNSVDAIVLYRDRTGFPPTMLELARLIGCASPNAAAEHVKALKKKGYISVAPGAARGITIVKTESDEDPVTIIKDLLSDGEKARDNAFEWLKKQGVAL